MTGYARVSAGSIVTGVVIQASHFNDEYNQLASAFDATTGHTHSGAAGEGAPITVVGTLTSGTWNGSVIAGQYGGTGVANTGKTITIGGNITHAGAFTQTFTATANTSVTLPTTGTLATLTGSETFTNKTLTSPTINTATISGGTINNASVGASTASTGRFTTLQATGLSTGLVHSDGTGVFTSSLVVAADVTNNTLTVNKLQQIGTLTLLGNSTGGTANVAQVAFGTFLQTANNLSDVTAATARTNLGLVIGTDVQAFDSDLGALAGNTTNGIWARTGSGAGSARTITAGTNIAVTNGDGVSGNPTIGITGQVAVANGGTGLGSLTANAVVLGNGTSAVQFVNPSTSGNVLTSNGTTWASVAPAAVTAAATQAEQETATSTTTYVSPGRQQYHPSAAKAWAYTTLSGSTPTLARSYNVSSITDNGVGDFTYNFTVAFSDTAYSTSGLSKIDSDAATSVFEAETSARAVGSCRIIVANPGNTVFKDVNHSVQFFGDQ